MVLGKTKSKTLRKVSIKTPGGKTTTQYKKRKPKNAKCASCNAVLKGVPRERPYKMQNLSKSKKRPNRPYGGKLCTKCTRKKIVNSIK